MADELPSPQDTTTAVLEKTYEVEQPLSSAHHFTRKELAAVSKDRLQASLSENAFQQEDVDILQQSQPTTDGLQTVLYLAYGSNLCAKTFQGFRGIRPLAAINVVVPELVLTFNLPGVPYKEPCFANTKFKHPDQSPEKLPEASEDTPLMPRDNQARMRYENPVWSKGLAGVVYEVSVKDYAHIMATEGGGSAYQDIVIACHGLPNDAKGVPQVPHTPAFKAHTLFCPMITADEARKGRKGRIGRPDPDYARPSSRYLGLLREGANEHNLPPDYQAYLNELQPFVVTTRGQKIGVWIMDHFWWPLISFSFNLSKKFANSKGRDPPWLLFMRKTLFEGVWIAYDWMYKPLFGDGERS